MQPITPTEVKVGNAKRPEVIAAFDSLIKERWDGRQARFKLKEVVDRVEAATGWNRQEMYDKHYFDVEPVYEQAGWDVTFDQAGFNERQFDPYFIFAEAGR